MQAEKHRFLKGVVGGLDLTKHEVVKTTIVNTLCHFSQHSMKHDQGDEDNHWQV